MGTVHLNAPKEKYTDSLDAVIVALCRDYKRREDAIASDSFSKRTKMEYKYINYRLKEAADEIAGGHRGEAFINEIGKKLGYAYSNIEYISETTYKQIKRDIKLNMAKKMHLID